MYRVEYKRSVTEELKGIPKPQFNGIFRRLQAVGLEPRSKNAKILEAETGLYRVRQDNYRIIYSIKDDVVTILNIKLGYRKDVYDKA